jgi:hypothetical protein
MARHQRYRIPPLVRSRHSSCRLETVVYSHEPKSNAVECIGENFQNEGVHFHNSVYHLGSVPVLNFSAVSEAGVLMRHQFRPL